MATTFEVQTVVNDTTVATSSDPDFVTFSGECVTAQVLNKDTSKSLYVHCREIHGENEYVEIASGQSLVLRSSKREGRLVNFKVYSTDDQGHLFAIQTIYGRPSFV